MIVAVFVALAVALAVSIVRGVRDTLEWGDAIVESKRRAAIDEDMHRRLALKKWNEP